MNSASASCTEHSSHPAGESHNEETIVGRFAPSPSGPLHLGSLLSALASYLDVRSRGGHWLLRIDDLDEPRSVPGSVDQICRALENHCLHWDGEVSWQSKHQPQYLHALDRLDSIDALFACRCTRKMVAGRPYPCLLYTSDAADE